LGCLFAHFWSPGERRQSERPAVRIDTGLLRGRGQDRLLSGWLLRMLLERLRRDQRGWRALLRQAILAELPTRGSASGFDGDQRYDPPVVWQEHGFQRLL